MKMSFLLSVCIWIICLRSFFVWVRCGGARLTSCFGTTTLSGGEIWCLNCLWVKIFEELCVIVMILWWYLRVCLWVILFCFGVVFAISIAIKRTKSSSRWKSLSWLLIKVLWFYLLRVVSNGIGLMFGCWRFIWLLKWYKFLFFARKSTRRRSRIRGFVSRIKRGS